MFLVILSGWDLIRVPLPSYSEFLLAYARDWNFYSLSDALNWVQWCLPFVTSCGMLLDVICLQLDHGSSLWYVSIFLTSSFVIGVPVLIVASTMSIFMMDKISTRSMESRIFADIMTLIVMFTIFLSPVSVVKHSDRVSASVFFTPCRNKLSKSLSLIAATQSCPVRYVQMYISRLLPVYTVNPKGNLRLSQSLTISEQILSWIHYSCV